MNKIDFWNLQLKTFTEQDALDYCLLNNVNPDKIIILSLNHNGNFLTDISGIKLLKNLKYLDLWNNKLTDISVLKNLNNLKYLSLCNNKITDISDLKNLINIKKLSLSDNPLSDISILKNLNLLKLNIDNCKITDISVIKHLKNLKKLFIRYLELESDQIQYINSCKNLKELYCYNGFKDPSVLKKLNKNINIYK